MRMHLSPMNIAFIVDEFPSISQTFVMNQITGLLDRGHDVDIYTHAIGVNHTRHPDVQSYRLMDRTYHLNCPKNRTDRVLHGVGLCISQFKKNGRATLGSLNVMRYGRTASSLTLLYKAAPFFFREYDIIHCHFGHNGRLGAMLKELRLQKKLVVTFHGCDIRKGISEGGAIYRELWNQADCLIAISDYNREYLLRFGGDPKKIVCHPVGIDCKRFQCRRSPARVCSSPVRLLSVARLVTEKGLEFSLRAVHGLKQERPDISLQYDIIGEGSLRSTLQRLIDELDLGDSVHLLGAKSQDEVIAALCSSDILVAPSLAEALPVSLMEAHAVGLPVLGTDVGSVNQIVQQEVSGFLVPPGDAGALCRRLAELIDDPQKRAEMGRRGRRHVEQNYDIERLNDRLVDIYQHLLAA
jgi:colanic acid/amylovoran biosynthesis glycosyltransferase